MAIQIFTTGEVLTAAQMNTLQQTVATYNAIGRSTTTTSITSSSNTGIVDNTNFSGTISAAAGDLVQATFTTRIDAGANIVHFNFYTFNGATAINAFIVPSTFNPFFYDTAFTGMGMMVAQYKLVAGDIISNQVTVKATANSAGQARQVVNGVIPSQFTVTNLGKVQ